MPTNGGGRVAAVLRWADERAEHAEARHQLFAGEGQPAISAVTYVDVPWPGWTFGITYGASLMMPTGVEFVTIVRGESPMWTWAIADFVDRHRVEMVGGLDAGHTINWHEPISPDSPMDALVIAEPRSLDPDTRTIHLSDDDHVRLLQVVPVHAQELELVRRLGVDRFLDQLGDSALDPRRTPYTE